MTRKKWYTCVHCSHRFYGFKPVGGNSIRDRVTNGKKIGCASYREYQKLSGYAHLACHDQVYNNAAKEIERTN